MPRYYFHLHSQEGLLVEDHEGMDLPELKAALSRCARAGQRMRSVIPSCDLHEIGIMAGKSPVAATEEQRCALMALSRSRDRGEADRARAILLTLSGWTSGQIAEAFGVREDTVRFWRSTFVTGGIEALRTSVAPGPAPIKAACALAVAEEVLSGPVANRPNWTLPRLADEIERRAGVRISSSRLSVVLRQKGISAGDGLAIR